MRRFCLITGVKFTLNSFLMLFVIFYVNSEPNKTSKQAADCERVKNNNSLMSWQTDTNRNEEKWGWEDFDGGLFDIL